MMFPLHFNPDNFSSIMWSSTGHKRVSAWLTFT